MNLCVIFSFSLSLLQFIANVPFPVFVQLMSVSLFRMLFLDTESKFPFFLFGFSECWFSVAIVSVWFGSVWFDDSSKTFVVYSSG